MFVCCAVQVFCSGFGCLLFVRFFIGLTLFFSCPISSFQKNGYVAFLRSLNRSFSLLCQTHNVQNKPSRNFHSTCGNKFYTVQYFLCSVCFFFSLLSFCGWLCESIGVRRFTPFQKLHTVQSNVASNVMTTIH